MYDLLFTHELCFEWWTTIANKFTVLKKKGTNHWNIVIAYNNNKNNKNKNENTYLFTCEMADKEKNKRERKKAKDKQNLAFL